MEDKPIIFSRYSDNPVNQREYETWLKKYINKKGNEKIKMKIEINDRLYNDFVVWARANSMNEDDMQKYVEKAFRDKFTLDKYGDLNEKVQEIKTEKKNKKTTRKKSEDVNEGVNEGVNDSEHINEYVNEHINEYINEQINEQINEPEKPKRKTKVIQSK